MPLATDCRAPMALAWSRITSDFASLSATARCTSGDAVEALNTIFAAAVALTRLSAPSSYTHRKKPILYRSTGTLNQGIELHVKEVYRTCSILVSKW